MRKEFVLAPDKELKHELYIYKGSKAGFRMSEIVLDVKNVSKCFQLTENRNDHLKEIIAGFFSSSKNSGGNFYALKNISFQLNEGEVLGIIGKNGAGKSTLLRVLSGITKPDTGQIDFYGKPASVLDVGAGFHPELTGRQNIFLAAQLYGLSKQQTSERIDRIILFSGIENFIDEPVKNYSAGMYLRLAFAVVTQIDADILIFDEVLGVGDAEFQSKVNDYMKQQAGRKSFILVSHNLLGIGKLCGRILLLDKGECIAEGSQEVIIRHLENSTPASQENFSPTDNNHVVINEKLAGSEVILNWVNIKGKSGHVQGKILNNEMIEISASLENATGNEDVVFQIHDQYDSPLFATSTLEAAEIVREQSGNAETKITCLIPPWFFNKGIFTLNVFVVTDKKNIQLKKTDVLKFAVSLAEDSHRSAFSDNYPGGVKPLHHWTIQN